MGSEILSAFSLRLKPRAATNRKSWLLSKDEGDPILANVKNVAAQRYLYSPRDERGGRDAELESKLAGCENLIKGIWPQVARDFVDLDGNKPIRKGLALFISLLFLRHPRRLDKTENIHRQLRSSSTLFLKMRMAIPP